MIKTNLFSILISVIFISGCATYVGQPEYSKSAENYSLNRMKKCIFRQGVLFKEADGFSLIARNIDRDKYYGLESDWIKTDLLSSVCSEVEEAEVQLEKVSGEFYSTDVGKHLASKRASNSEYAEIYLLLVDRDKSDWTLVPKGAYFFSSLLTLGMIPFYKNIDAEMWIYISKEHSSDFSAYELAGDVSILLWTPLVFLPSSYSMGDAHSLAFRKLLRGMAKQVIKSENEK